MGFHNQRHGTIKENKEKQSRDKTVVIMYFFFSNGMSFSFVQRNNFDYYKIINDVIIMLNFY